MRRQAAAPGAGELLLTRAALAPALCLRQRPHRIAALGAVTAAKVWVRRSFFLIAARLIVALVFLRSSIREQREVESIRGCIVNQDWIRGIRLSRGVTGECSLSADRDGSLRR
jgi:hypothetical protein